MSVSRAPAPVRQHEPVARGAVVVRRGEPFEMQAPTPSRGQHDRPREHGAQRALLEVVEHRARTFAVLVGQQLHGGRTVQYGDAAIEFDRFAQHAHDFEPREITVAQHARHGCASRSFAHEAHAVLVEVECDTKRDQPADRLGAIGCELRDERRIGCVVARMQGVVGMLPQAVFFADGRLNAAFGHYRIAVADAQLGGQRNVRASGGGFDGGGCPRAAAADYEHVGVRHRQAGQIDFVDQRVRFEQLCEERVAGRARVRADTERHTCAGTVVGMVGGE